MSIVITPTSNPPSEAPTPATNIIKSKKVVILNQATFDLGLDMPKLGVALQKYVNQHLLPAWGTGILVSYLNARAYDSDQIPIIIVDDYEHIGTLGYHTLIKSVNGYRVFSFVFAKQCIKFNTPIEQTVSHELAEIIFNPSVNLWVMGPNGVLYIREVADPVENEWFDVDGFKMSNFVHPAWFEKYRLIEHTKFDEMGSLSVPFTLTKGGYITTFKDGKTSQVWGSAEKQAEFMQEDRRGHRTEIIESYLK